jgi:hypothetical protein
MAEELKKQTLEKGDAVAMNSHKTIVIRWHDGKQVSADDARQY